MAAFFLKKKKEVTETVEELQKTVEAAKKEAETVNTEPPATIVCPACGREINKKTAEKNKYVCYECGNYFRVRTKNRIRMVADKDTFEPWFEELESKNPLDFPGYPEKIKAAQEKTGLHEAVTVGKCRIYGLETVIGVCDARFMMSSMGHVVGEKNRTCGGACDRTFSSGYFILLFRWCKNAGGNRFPDADGKDSSCFKETFRGRTFICAGVNRSYDRRCDGKFCDVRRYYPCRAGGTDWICRAACHRADDRRETAGGIPEGTVPVRAWFCGCDRGA